MSDIRIEHGLPGKPEVLEIAMAMGVSRAEVIGHLVQVWLWADQTTREGRCEHCPKILDGITLEGFSAAMEASGWLLREGNGFALPRIERYTGDGRTSRDRRLVQKERAKNQSRGSGGRFAKTPVGSKKPTTTDTQPTSHLPSDGRISESRPTKTKADPAQPDPTNTTHIHLGDGDYTGDDIPATRYHYVCSKSSDLIAGIIDAIPSAKRRAPNKIRRSVAAALDRGVNPDMLRDQMRGYYASDEGLSEYATWPHNFIDNERYDEDPEAWVRTTDAAKGNAKEML